MTNELINLGRLSDPNMTNELINPGRLSVPKLNEHINIQERY